MIWGSVMPLGILFAMVGGILGALWASIQNHDGLVRSFLEALISAIAAAAVADYLLPINRIWVCAGIGVLVGLLVGHALDVIKVIAPTVLKGFVESLAKKWLGYEKKE